MDHRRSGWLLALGWVAVIVTPAGAQSILSKADVHEPERKGAPLLACTPVELSRLHKSWKAGEPVLVKLVARARKRLGERLVFPPRGGQHNQWYQCDKCQLGLKTLGPTRHQCPKCKKVYTGAPYDDVIFSRVHGHNWARAREAGRAYALTGEARFAVDAKRIILGYAERYERYPYHTNSKGGLRKVSGGGHIKEQSLSEASLMIDSIVPACDLVWATFSTAERKQVREHLIRPMLENLERAPRGKSNWQSFHNAAMFAGGALIGEERWMRRSIFHPSNGFLFQIEHCVSPEGMWFENSWGYHLYTLRALTSHAEFARRVGIDLWHAGQAGRSTLQRMVELPVAYTMPDGSLPRFGDDVHSRLSHRMAFLQAARPMFESPLLDRIAQGPATWESILHGNQSGPSLPGDQGKSRLFRGAGHAILRSPGPKALCSVMTFGRFGGFHGHFDKLSFVLFADGRECGVDPGRARSQAYRLPIHKLWYRGTIAHNAVVVDGQPQRGASGKLLMFASNEHYQAVAAEVATAYEGLRHARCLVQTQDYLIVLDDLRSAGAQRRFDWIYHDRSRSVRCEAAASPVGDKARQVLDMSGGRFVELQSTGSTHGDVQAHFEGTDRALELRMAAADVDTRVFTGTGPAGSVLDRVPMIILRRRGRQAGFACVLEPLEPRGASGIASFTAKRKEGQWVVHLRSGNSQVRIEWDGARELELRRSPAEGK